MIEALAAGLAAYEGKALVNSVTGEDDRLEAILPLVAEHGAAVIGLANDDEIPMDAQRRLEVAAKIVGAAGDYGIPPEDVVIDPLAMPIGAEPRAVTLFVETVRLIRDNLGVNMTCGASNTAFGLPRRPTLGGAFLAISQAHGLTSAIMDARSPECVDAVRAGDVLLGKDEWGARWIADFRARQAQRDRMRHGAVARAESERLPGWPTAFCCASSRTTGRSRRRACPRARPSSTPRAGTASRSTRPAAGTGRARSAGARDRGRGAALSPVDPRAFSADELRAGWRLACRAPADEDLVSRCRRCRRARRRRSSASAGT